MVWASLAEDGADLEATIQFIIALAIIFILSPLKNNVFFSPENLVFLLAFKFL